jgi:hypothetical protein
VLCVQSSECEVPFIGKGGRLRGWAHFHRAAESVGVAGPVIHRLSPWTLLITSPEVVEGRFLG